MPIVWLSDMGSIYTSDETRAFGAEIGFEMCTTPPYSPESFRGCTCERAGCWVRRQRTLAYRLSSATILTTRANVLSVAAFATGLSTPRLR